MDAVIFDMDGVIIDSEPLHFLTDKAVAEKFGIEVSENFFDSFVGVTNPVMWKKIIKDFDVDIELDEILNFQLSLKLKLLKKGSYSAIEGIPELLQELYVQDIPIAIASSSSSIFIKEVIKKLKLQKYFSIWVSAENVEKSKPEPDVFLRTAELLQVLPEHCLVIEDSKNGVLAAKKSGMKCIGYANSNSGEQDLKKADKIIDSFASITLKDLYALF